MSDVYQIAAVGMLQGKGRLEAISLNAASASLTGYRRHVVVGQAFDAALATSEAVRGTTSAVANAASRQQVNLQRGAMVATGRTLDLAIDAEDLFFALTDGSQTWLTRAGAFRVNQDGVLVGEGGLRVVGSQGDLQGLHGEEHVETDGKVLRDGVPVAALQLFRPNERSSLQAAPGSLLIAASGQQPVEAGATQIRSGVLEASNTDAGREMLSLMTVSRQFESLTRILQSYDDLLGRAIPKLGEV